MRTKRLKFLMRWTGSAIVLWLASTFFGSDIVAYGDHWNTLVIASLILALVNTFVKPVVTFLTLPAVLLSLGIFMLVINAFMVLVAAQLYEPLMVDGFGIAVIIGIMIGLVNWLLSVIIEEKE